MATRALAGQVGTGSKVNKLRRTLVTPEGIALDIQLAGAGTRAGAVILDLVFLFLMIIGYILFISLVLGSVTSIENSGFGAFVIVFSIILIFLLRNAYFLYFELGSRSATWGKRILGIRVASRDGGRLAPEAVIARNLIREIELFLPITYLLTTGIQGVLSNYAMFAGFIWIGVFLFFPFFNKDRLRCGDLVAGTWVVHAQKAVMTEIVATQEVSVSHDSAGYRFSEEELDIYGEYELKTLEKVLRNGGAEAERSVYEAICRKLGWTPGSGDERTFLENYYTQLRQRLEGGMRFGKRRADKFDQS